METSEPLWLLGKGREKAKRTLILQIYQPITLGKDYHLAFLVPRLNIRVHFRIISSSVTSEEGHLVVLGQIQEVRMINWVTQNIPLDLSLSSVKFSPEYIVFTI